MHLLDFQEGTESTGMKLTTDSLSTAAAELIIVFLLNSEEQVSFK